MSNLNLVIDALKQLENKDGNNYRPKYYYGDHRDLLNNIEHCRYYHGDVKGIYVLTFVDAAPCIHIRLNSRKGFIFPKEFIHKGIVYRVKITKPVA